MLLILHLLFFYHLFLQGVHRIVCSGQRSVFLTRWLFTIIVLFSNKKEALRYPVNTELKRRHPAPSMCLSTPVLRTECEGSHFQLSLLLLLRVPPLPLLREGEAREEQSDFRQADWQLRAKLPSRSEQQMQMRRCAGEEENELLNAPNWQAVAVRDSAQEGMSFHFPRVVCIITGFLEEEAAVADGNIEREQRQTHNAPGVIGGKATVPRSSRSPIWFPPIKPISRLVLYPQIQRLTSWSSHSRKEGGINCLPALPTRRRRRRASGLISKLSHDVSGEIPKRQGDSGRIWDSS